jgi:hypothetical protein
VRRPRAGRSNSSEPFRAWGGDLKRAKALANFSRGRGDIGTYFGELGTYRRGRAPTKAKLAEHRAQ